MLNLRQRLFLIMSVIIGALLIIVLIILAITRRDTPVGPIQETSPQVDTTDDTPLVYDPTLNLTPVVGGGESLSPGLANEDTTSRYVRQRAIDFVERFLSYSNQNRNSHISDVLPFVTADMAGWVETKTQAYSPLYEGSTTHVIVSRVESIDASTATVHIEAQQVLEHQGEPSTRVYHTGRVELVAVNSDWLIDGLYWD